MKGQGGGIGQRGGTIQSSMIATGSQNIVAASKPTSKTQLLNNFLDSAKGMIDPRNEGQLNMSSKRGAAKQQTTKGVYGDSQLIP